MMKKKLKLNKSTIRSLTDDSLLKQIVSGAPETGAIMCESMDFTAPRMREVWPHWFPDLDFAKRSEHKPRELAKYIYGKETKIRQNLGNTDPDDGWNYRGGDLMQTTGPAGYRKFGRSVGIDLENHPELIEIPIISLNARCAE